MFRAFSAFVAALPACVIIIALPPSAAPALQTPTNLVASEPILLRATTPLGEASIEIAAGATLTNFEIQGDKVRVWQGPFTTTVALADVQPPEPTPAPTPEPTATPEPSPEATPTPAAAAAPAQPQDPPSTWVFDSGSWPPWVFPAAVGALALYALLATLALIRVRQPGKPEVHPSAPAAKPGPAKSATASKDGSAIHCPHCSTDIPIAQISPGRNTCPSCRNRFVCE